MEDKTHTHMPQRLAACFRLPRFLIFSAYSLSRDMYTCALLIHVEASGEKGILPSRLDSTAFLLSRAHVLPHLSIQDVQTHIEFCLRLHFV